MNARFSVIIGLAALVAGSAAAQPSGTMQQPLSVALVEALNAIAGGPHAGFRANHAKGVMAAGEFVPTASARTLSSAPHFESPAPITVRFSNDSGRIRFPDASRDARPHGLAVRFHLVDGTSTDIVTNTTKAFPVSTPEKFLALLQAALASGPGVKKPTPLDRFVASHPTTRTYFDSFHPPPASFGTMTYFGLNAFKFTNLKGESRYVRYQVRPVSGEQYLSEAAAAREGPDYLMNELPARLAKGAVKFVLYAQLAKQGDDVNDPAIAWSSGNPVVELGTLVIDRFIADPEANRAILFNPVSLPAGIEPSADPVLALRFPAYAVSFRQRAIDGAALQMVPPSTLPKSEIEVFARSKNCLNCHAITGKLVGPAFTEIAARYRSDGQAEATLVQKVLRGGQGAWGQIPMPANTHVSEVEARSLVKWVLQQ